MKIFTISLLALSALLTACDTVNTIEKSKDGTYQSIVHNPFLDSYAQVSEITTLRTESGLFKAQAKITNTSTGYKTINYRFCWLDKNKMVVDDTSSLWQTVALEGKETKYIYAVSSNPNVCDFSLKLLNDVRD